MLIRSISGPTVLTRTWSRVLHGSLLRKDEVGRKTVKRKMTGAAGLAAAFVAGMLVATVLGAGMAAARAKTPGCR